MMQIERFGIKLIRIGEEHIEEIRMHRNSPSISNFMEYREFITAEMQQKWFRSLDPVIDFYFVIRYKNENVGLIHTSTIDWRKKEGHAGLFIWAQKYWSTYIPVMASLSMVDLFFCYCVLEKIFAKVMRTNHAAIQYNKNLGFKRKDPNESGDFLEYVLNRDDYLEATAKLHRLAENVEDRNYKITISGNLMQQLKSVNAVQQSISADASKRLHVID